jgi:hypothetical protein
MTKDENLTSGHFNFPTRRRISLTKHLKQMLCGKEKLSLL